MNFGWADGSFGMLEAEQLDSSILAAIGSVIAPIFAPLGWGNWKMAVAAITGLIAKENVSDWFCIYGKYPRSWIDYRTSFCSRFYLSVSKTLQGKRYIKSRYEKESICKIMYE